MIRISLQGLDSTTYKRICGVDIDYSEFISNLEYLYQHRGQTKIRIKIADIALQGVRDGEKKFKETFGEMADSIFIENIIPIYSEVHYDDINKKIMEQGKNGRYGLRQKRVNKVCYRPFIKLLVAIDGSVSAACCDHISGKDIVYGNINRATLKELWDSNERRKFLLMQLEGKRFAHPYCKKCVVPNDISSMEDLLDPYVEEILGRFENHNG